MVAIQGIRGWASSELNLGDREATMDAINGAKPDTVIDAAHAEDVERFLFPGSSCIYPRYATQPLRVDGFAYFLKGPMTASVDGVPRIAASQGTNSKPWATWVEHCCCVGQQRCSLLRGAMTKCCYVHATVGVDF